MVRAEKPTSSRNDSLVVVAGIVVGGERVEEPPTNCYDSLVEVEVGVIVWSAKEATNKS